MKLIIDIPDQMYLNAKADTLCGSDILVKAVKNGIPHETVTEFADRCSECGREKVLDKIRAEIMQLDYDTESIDYDHNDMPQTETVHTICQEEVLQIIDRYKAESEDKG
jgi:hypothetical protein